MTLKECMLIKNECYKRGQKITNGKPTGIVVHSTGANNKTLKRYVQPVKEQSYYDEVMADLGTNKLGNHWNRSSVLMGRKVCVHAFIGVNANGEVETYQTLPFDICCWGVGKGKKGSYNYNPQARVQFEICEDNLKDEDYFNKAMKEAQEFCAYLCKKYGFGVDKISSHYESYWEGYGGNHGDCDHWLKKFGKDMDWFRAEVDKLLGNGTKPTDDTKPTDNKREEKTVTIKLPVLKKGSNRDEVKTLQRLLKSMGYKDQNGNALNVDGDFGSKTDYAVKAFQKAKKLSVDGSVGSATWSALLEVE